MVSAKRKPLDTKRFHHMTGELFADQYYHIYNARLNSAREALLKNSQIRWGDEVKNVPLEQLNSTLGKTEVFVIGTLFKLMPKQPSILRELDGETTISNNNAESESKVIQYTSDEDSLVLHETDENVIVVGDIDIHKHVTGIPVALLGHQQDDGAKFHVTDICYAGLDLSVYSTSNSFPDVTTNTKNERLLIISGLEFGFDSTLKGEKCMEVVSALKKLREFVLGEDMDDFEITKIIIAGNSIGPGYTKSQIDINNDDSSQSKTDERRSLKEVFDMFDRYLISLAQCGAEIHIMPGKNDPASFLLPQQPFHPKILPHSGVLKNVLPETNPCLVEFNDYAILGTSGENIEAILKYSRIELGITAIKNTLEWGHIAPSAPDNLSCVPFRDKDPFIIDFQPDIYFAGNQAEFAATTFKTETKSKIQIISVPSFVKTLSCVIVDLRNLDVELKSFY